MSARLTPEREAEIRARLETATVADPAPWTFDEGEGIVRNAEGLRLDRHYAIGSFIAHAPTDLAALLRELDLLRADATAALDAAARARTDVTGGLDWLDTQVPITIVRARGVTHLRLRAGRETIVAPSLAECVDRARAAAPLPPVLGRRP